MIVCSCNVLSDGQVRELLGRRSDRPSVGAVFRHMGCEPRCGRCARNISALVDQHASSPSDHCSGAGECDNCRADELAA
ncbi:bacterioferritin-associated ferredoxin [Methylosinus sp. Sm6]|uniref:(2Fe-2S)-binding protein n=1 Tax=Methylosinus sp. Sm6 TaxID=2866948 RepID=UPI001C996104|nr:(2Fe-2S)-binding protein [Methylosinus sp. Sm6]MBY6240706.1 (2Fe-2S)-binding protein [Methylosinus sp. Sm6]